ncbi:MAG: ABC transporter substrate-binding protein [Deltaproteobacteria bacterium]|jgi:polar amino acid transport system substrate-binding protein|nr:ABC transporter substrate-binding protein [Deltaproteobacteria bacterium]
MIRKLALLCVFAAFFAASPLFADGELINGIDSNFAPFAFVGPDGKPAGFDVEALDWIAQKQGFKVVHKPMEWDGIVTSLKDKKIDMIASGLSVSEVRAQQISFTVPYWTVKQVILVPKDSKLTLEEALTGGRDLGVQKGTSEAASLEAAKDKDGRKYNVRTYETYELAVADVVNGRIAGAVLNDAPAAQAVANQPVKVLGDAGIPEEQYAYGVNKENPELLATLNEGLTLLMADPFWQTLVAKYKPGDPH